MSVIENDTDFIITFIEKFLDKLHSITPDFQGNAATVPEFGSGVISFSLQI